ncbi:putative C2H2 zinc finger domain protein [Aspergillus bombycis]|uniref:Putative C2H2 zinc finger domain protein n=1 Tax=Aspergillus bombycis TaxID=109264 RepID=A0A1F8A3S0_9EURO|nr:putative C2H2 zinc finger domain protein [Aspergillus bombycis]OGM46370.1 putative C2H2 zinc finger domain protein [Aspergillus bombycis]
MGSSRPNEYYDLLSFVGHYQTGYCATSEDGHLMPNASMDPNSSSNYQSAATSPVSPLSCTSADLLPGGTALPEIDTDFYLFDSPANDISPTLPMDAGHVPSTERLLSTSVPQIPHLYCPPSVSSPDPLDEVRADLHRLQSTVRSSVRNVSHSHRLFEMRSLVRDTFCCLDTMIQDEVDYEIHSPNSTNSTNSNNDSNHFAGYGSSFYGNSYSRENSFPQLVEQRLSHSPSSVSDRDDAPPDPVLFSPNPGKQASEINHLRPNSLSGHHQLLDFTLERNPQVITPRDNSGHHSGRKSHNPRGPSQTTSCNDKSPHRTTLFKELSLKKSQARPASEPPNLVPKKCKLCDHIMTTCVECKLHKGAVNRCHLCAGKASQQHGSPRVLEDYDQYYDFACNGMSDRNRSASKIAWALEQVSQAFKPKGDPCSTGNSRTSTDYLFDESPPWVSVMTAIDRVYALQVSEQSTFKAMGSSYSIKVLPSALEPHATRSRFTAMTLALDSPQIYSKIGHSGSFKCTHIELSEVLYGTRNITGDTSVAYESDSQKVAVSALTAEYAIPCLAKTSESLCTIPSTTVSSRNHRIRTLSVGPHWSGTLSLHDLTVEPTALEISGGFTFHRVVKDRQSSQRSTLLMNASSAAEDQLTRRRHSKLRRKLQVIIGILVLQASVAHTLPVSKQLEDGNLRSPTVASEDTDLVEPGSDLDSSDLNFLPQWLRETISSFSAGLIDNVESSMFATPVYKAEEEIWPKVKTFVGSMASYLETPVSPTVIEQHIAEYRKLRVW